MGNVVVVGAQWGDEGKGKIVDWLSRARRRRRALPGRPQRRPHAGHRRQRLQAVACCPRASCGRASSSSSATAWWSTPGRCSPRSRSCAARASAIAPENLSIAENAPLILPLHRDARPDARGGGAATAKIGTTGRGIGPAYEDKVGRRAIRVADLGRRRRRSETRLDRLLAAPQRAARAGSARRRSTAAELLARAARGRAARSCPTPSRSGSVLDEQRRAGTPHPVRGRAGRAARHRPRHLSLRHLLQHAWPGRPRPAPASARARSATCSASPRPTPPASASGPFPTELNDEIGQQPRRARPRVRHRHRAAAPLRLVRRGAGAPDRARSSGINGIALTKLDVLDGFDELKICIGYELDGERLDHLPAGRGAQARVEPVYETLRRLDGDHRAAPAPGPTCRRRRSSTSAASRS